MNDAQNKQAYNHFNVILTGRIKNDFKRREVIKQVAALFGAPPASIADLLEKSPSVVKRDIPHKKAYQIQAALEKTGAESLLKMLPIVEVEPTFSMVPEGEEQTPYAQLNQRLQSGEQVECSHCHSLQPLTPYCADCGRQLMGATVRAESLSSVAKKSGHVLSLVIISLLLAVAVLFYLIPF